MLRKILIFLLAILFIGGACSLPSAIKAVTPQNTILPATPTQSQAATQAPTSSGSNQSESQATVQESIPLAPDSRFDPNRASSEKPDDKNGSFTINSQSTIDSLVHFYADELPKQSWTLRYVDANRMGGVTQSWEKGNIYLSLDFGFEDGQLLIKGNYHRLDPQAAQKLPKDFPLPVQAELVDASDNYWQIYVPQDYLSVTNFYNQRSTSLQWAKGTRTEQGECGGDCENSTSSFPAGVTPMPSPTPDPRRSNDLFYTMPDGNEIDLLINPHQNGTIIYVTVTLKNIASAGLPKDVPIYPGATVSQIETGMATFDVNADVATIENFYKTQLTAAGWTKGENSSVSSSAYFQDWQKAGQSISINVSSAGDNRSILIIICNTCSP